MIAHLAIDVGRVVSVERLIDRLWGDEPPRTPLGTLQSYVSRLRRTIEPAREAGAAPQVLVSEAPGYVLRVPVDDGRRAPLHGDRQRGPQRHRRRVRGAGARALRRRPRALARAGAGRGRAGRAGAGRWSCASRRSGHSRSRTASRCCWRSAATPRRCRPCSWRSTSSRCGSGCGRCWRWPSTGRAGRPTPCGRCRRRARSLLDELGLDPGPELRTLESRILAQDPALLATPDVVAPTVGGSRARRAAAHRARRTRRRVEAADGCTRAGARRRAPRWC